MKWNLVRMRVDHELRALSRGRSSLEEHLALAVELEVPDVYSRWSAEGYDDQAVAQLGGDEIWILRHDVFPRMFRGSYVTITLAVFEDCVLHLAQEAKRVKKSDRDFGLYGSVIDNCIEFFGKQLGYPLWVGEVTGELKLLTEVRNVFAHQGGRLDGGQSGGDTKTKAREKARENLEKRRKIIAPLTSGESPALSVHDGYLVPSAEFLAWSVSLVEWSVTQLADQVTGPVSVAADLGRRED